MADLPAPPKKKARVKGPVSGTPLKRAAPYPKRPAKRAAGVSTETMASKRLPEKPKGGIDLPKFASEVSGNYAKGVAQVGGEVNKAIAGVGAGVNSAIAGVRKLAGSNAGISNAMKTGADKNNPLHRMLRQNQTGGRK